MRCLARWPDCLLLRSFRRHQGAGEKAKVKMILLQKVQLVAECPDRDPTPRYPCRTRECHNLIWDLTILEADQGCFTLRNIHKNMLPCDVVMGIILVMKRHQCGLVRFSMSKGRVKLFDIRKRKMKLLTGVSLHATAELRRGVRKSDYRHS